MVSAHLKAKEIAKMFRTFRTENNLLLCDPVVNVGKEKTLSCERFREMWKPSEVERIAETLNRQKLPADQNLSELCDAIRSAIQGELQRQCDQHTKGVDIL